MDYENRIKFTRAMHDLIQDVIEGKIENGYLAGRLKNAIDWIESLHPDPENEKPKQKKLGEPGLQEIRDVFEYWKNTTNRQKSRLNQDKKRKITARLREGFTVAQLCRIVDWSQTDPYYMGDNDRNKRYDTISTLFRNSERVEDLLERSNKTIPEGKNNSFIDDLIEQSSVALREGRIDEYNRIEEKIRESKSK